MYNPQLDTFIRVAEAGSFSKAAQILYITPTAVIKQMNLLESRLGLTLFHRSHQGLTLTKAGESLLADARYIAKYSNEAITRARIAERNEKRVVRVGVSPMTPTTMLTELWPAIHERCPNMSMQVVTFENTPTAPHALANLGQDIDIILGVYGPAMLKERGCDAFELARLPLCCAVPANSKLATHDVITFEDLHEHTLMIIRQGWNEDMDALRNDIAAHHPSINVEDFPQYRIDMFNRCANEELAMVSLDLWHDVHPMLKTLPTNWGYAVSYGFFHAIEPSEHVEEFLHTAQEVLAER